VPKLYEYLGLIILFYSNEHTPIHVHGKYQEKESKADIIIENGKIVEIRITHVKGKRPLDGKELRNFRKVVEYFKEDIVQKWIDFFVYNKSIESKNIDKEI
jgi:hypothetical protein